MLHKLKITDYTSTPKSGRVSLSKSYLESHPNIYLRLIARARAYDKLIMNPITADAFKRALPEYNRFKQP